ncbi:hypothetical protein [Mycobacterium neglectum]|uniref:hypothetical protein n=1 Tax=Mycobacterium neglectum TaxID=242737 RepID=UPI000BFF02ED|nr:hypothetical protein [Mycobacterium neglectum]
MRTKWDEQSLSDELAQEALSELRDPMGENNDTVRTLALIGICAALGGIDKKLGQIVTQLEELRMTQ